MELTPEAKTELAARMWRSHSEFCRIALKDWFPTKMPWVHRGIAALIERKTDWLLDFGTEVWRDEVAEWTPADLQKILTNFIDEKTGEPLFELKVGPEGAAEILIHAKDNVGIIMPRGFSKTTLLNSINLKKMLFKDVDFFLYLSESLPHAIRQLDTIKDEVDDSDGDPKNPLIYAMFGKIKPDRQSPKKWTEKFIETETGVMVGAVGTGGQVRGFGKNAKRPAILLFDDLEDEETVESDEQRKKTNKWFWSAALPAKRKGGRAFIIGTLLHVDALLMKVVKSLEFTVVRFGAIDRQGDALWEYMMSLEEIEAKKLNAAEVGELPGFYFEYMSVYHDDNAKMFPEAKLVYVSKKDSVNWVGKALAMDPAISEESTADFCTFGVVGIEAGGKKHLLDYHGERGMDPDAQIDKFFELHIKHMLSIPPDFCKYGIEAIGYQRALVSLVTSRQFLMSRTLGIRAYFEVEPIFHGKIGKIPRIKGIMKPLIATGYFTFEQKWADLHTMFTEFPGGKKDGPDVCAMAVKLLDPFAALGIGDEGMQDLEKDTQPPLSVVLGGKYEGACP